MRRRCAIDESLRAACACARAAGASSGLFGGGVIGRRQRLYQLVVERGFGPLDHRQAVAAVIVLDLVHDVVNQEHAAPRRLDEVGGVARVWNLGDVEALALVLD